MALTVQRISVNQVGGWAWKVKMAAKSMQTIRLKLLGSSSKYVWAN